MRWGLVPRLGEGPQGRLPDDQRQSREPDLEQGLRPLVGKFRHRCLIVADGFYEWMVAEDPKQPRQPWRFTVDGGEPFAFAGLCTRKEWDDAEERGVGSGRLSLQRDDHHDDAERGRQTGPRPDAGDPAERRGGGRLAATRGLDRGGDRDVRAARPAPDGRARPPTRRSTRSAKGWPKGRSCWSPLSPLNCPRIDARPTEN